MSDGKLDRVWILIPMLVACRTQTPAVEAPGQVHAAQQPETAPTVDAAEPEAVGPISIPEDASSTASGLRYRLLSPASGGSPPGRVDAVVVRYTVWDASGEIIGQSRPGGTDTLEMEWLPPGWAEGMQLLGIGDRTRLWLPPELAYADKPDGPQGPLKIDVELVDIERRTPLSATSPQELSIAAPPVGAQRTASGIAYVVIRHGTGSAHPGPEHQITTHYEGWTTDGERFDSSYARGRPITIQLSHVIEGWGEALPLMVTGEKTRFWIPEHLAYKGRSGRPQGMLVFDIELIEFK